MTISSSSTQEEIIAEYLDNASYDSNGSSTQCQSFIVACRALLVMHPSNWEQAGAKIAYNPQLWQEEMNSAKSWLASYGNGGNSNSGGVSHLSFGEGFR